MDRNATNTTKELGKILQYWKMEVLVYTMQKGDTKECKNYRGIALSSVVVKAHDGR